ncbi:hypothetical protein PH586_18960 [Pseudomonas sp. SA3-5]|uniref:Uncharacterized protein n=1 Tax=Pseudomonas aestuarii TaxID=3018340 RepID=A0ABT4XJR3_9PSED|nr:hypothetical protein [Pseudomonas aestuarii]MDA7088464.1 hypothetical protein [Pseudomonas aestuarii]
MQQWPTLCKVRYVATINLFVLLSNTLQLISYAALGQFSEENLLYSLMLSPGLPLKPCPPPFGCCNRQHS